MSINLDEVYGRYGHPDPATISILNKNGADLAYVGHAEITKALSEIDSHWSWEPILGADGLPAIRIQHGSIPRRDKDPIRVDMATMWGKLTLCGVTRWAVGSVEAHKPDLDKELVSDFLRNAAMRFGVALALWMKDSTAPASRPQMTERTSGNTTITEPSDLASDKQRNMIRAISNSLGKTPPVELQSFTKRQASAYIDQLKQMQDGNAPEPQPEYDTPEEPF
jgi:hypothetical protein